MTAMTEEEGRRIHTFTMTEAKAEIIHSLAKSAMSTLNNHIRSSLKRGDIDGAKRMVDEYDDLHTIFAAFNMDSKRLIHEHGDKPFSTQHTVKNEPLF